MDVRDPTGATSLKPSESESPHVGKDAAGLVPRYAFRLRHVPHAA